MPLGVRVFDHGQLIQVCCFPLFQLCCFPLFPRGTLLKVWWLIPRQWLWSPSESIPFFRANYGWFVSAICTCSCRCPLLPQCRHRQHTRARRRMHATGIRNWLSDTRGKRLECSPHAPVHLFFDALHCDAHIFAKAASAAFSAEVSSLPIHARTQTRTHAQTRKDHSAELDVTQITILSCAHTGVFLIHTHTHLYRFTCDAGITRSSAAVAAGTARGGSHTASCAASVLQAN